MDRAQFASVKSALRDLSVGEYPRVDSLPVLLNLYQSRFSSACGDNELLVYFHPTILHVPRVEDFPTTTSDVAHLTSSIGPRNHSPLPKITIEEHVRKDMKRRWRVLRKSYSPAEDTLEQQQQEGGTKAYGRYRFLFFIHKHRIEVPSSHDQSSYYQRSVYTVSIWDQEWDELIWHDAYPYGRRERRAAVRQFWERVSINLLPEQIAKLKLPGGIRYKTVYHTFGREPVDPADPQLPPPRQTIYFVLATAMFHINETSEDDQVVMPKSASYVWGQQPDLIPRLFFGGLVVCLESKNVPEDLDSQKNFLMDVKVATKLMWLRNGLRYYAKAASWPTDLLLALKL